MPKLNKKKIQNIADGSLTTLNSFVVASKEFFEAIQSPSNKLTSIVLDFYENDVANMEYLSQALQSPNNKLTSLTIYEAKINDVNIQFLCQALSSSNNKLTSLTFDTSVIFDTSMNTLCQFLQLPRSKLTSLGFVNNNEISDIGMSSICQLLTSPKNKLTSLNLTGTHQTSNTSMSAFFQALQSPNNNLTSIILDRSIRTDKYDDIDALNALDIFFESLSQTLQSPNNKLTSLTLFDTLITDTSMGALCRAIQSSNNKLTSLTLSACRVYDTGWEQLKKAIPASLLTEIILETDCPIESEIQLTLEKNKTRLSTEIILETDCLIESEIQLTLEKNKTRLSNLAVVRKPILDFSRWFSYNNSERSLAPGNSLIIEEKVYVFIKPKSDGKNKRFYDGVYATQEAYTAKNSIDRLHLDAYEKGELYFLKMFPTSKEKRVEGFTEALAGAIIKFFIQEGVIKPFFADCFIPTIIVQLPNNLGPALWAPFVHGAQSLFNLKNKHQKEKNAFTETIKRVLQNIGYEDYLDTINRDEKPYHGLSYIVMLMILLANYSVHSGNILFSEENNQTNFFGIDFGAAFRNFMGTVEQDNIWVSLEEQNKTRTDGWMFKKYLDLYKTIPGFYHAIVLHAEKLHRDLNENREKLTNLKKLMPQIIKNTLQQYKTYIIFLEGPESWKKNKDILFRYIYGKQYDALMEKINVEMRSNPKNTDIANDLFANDITQIIFSRLFNLSLQGHNIPEIHQLELYSSIPASSVRGSFASSSSDVFSRMLTGSFSESKNALEMKSVSGTVYDADHSEPNRNGSSPLN